MHTCLIAKKETYKLRSANNNICCPSLQFSAVLCYTVISNFCCTHCVHFYAFHLEKHQQLSYLNILNDFLITSDSYSKRKKKTFLAELKMPSHQDKKRNISSNFSKVPTATDFLMTPLRGQYGVDVSLP